jgi:tRNA pseudouridine38-40 synthase
MPHRVEQSAGPDAGKEIVPPGHVKLRLLVAYDGTGYEGWQVQKIGTGVQQKIEEALARLFPSGPRVHGSSRTDTGVHALGMVAHFIVPAAECPMPPRKLLLAINAWLPGDIRVMRVSRARAEFHARFGALGKEYRYTIWNHPAMNPLIRHSAWHVTRALDIKAMRLAATHFVGRHDFSSFTANPGYERKSTVRAITRCDVSRRGPLITLRIAGDGFLYKMCRGMAGTLAQVGLGKLQPGEIKTILATKDRRVAGMTAPAHGLALWKVFY